MRILFLSNYYPPFARGGYEQWCQEVADELARRGHCIRVITSRASLNATSTDDHGVQVHRVLSLEVEAGLARTVIRLLFSRRQREQSNLEQLQSLVANFQPDAALIWGMWNIPRSVPACVEALMANRVAYYICDYWLSLPSSYMLQLQNPSVRTLTRLPKQLISKPLLSRLKKESPTPLQLRHPICVSGKVRDLLVRDGISISHAEVIYGGIRPEEFASVADSRQSRNRRGLKLLYAGRLADEKGVSTAIRALALVRQSDEPVTLDIVGSGEASYTSQLRALVAQQRLHERVSFKGAVARAEMPNAFAQSDALVFPSEWEEPFARTVLEAMAAGLVVIGTTTGGTADVLVEGETGLTFPRGDAAALARQIERLRDEPALRARLAEAGRRCVQARFTFDAMVDRIEIVLKSFA